MDTLSKEVISKIKRNITDNNRKDVKNIGIKGTLTYDEFINKIKEQSNKCYVCLQEFQYNGKQWCYFFPSADRISNYINHNTENVAVSCLFCNIRMFKEVSEKTCGLCKGLNHIYNGDIITKSELFYNIGNDDHKIKEYINSINKV
jgi:lipoate synthase